MLNADPWSASFYLVPHCLPFPQSPSRAVLDAGMAGLMGDLVHYVPLVYEMMNDALMAAVCPDLILKLGEEVKQQGGAC